MDELAVLEMEYAYSTSLQYLEDQLNSKFQQLVSLWEAMSPEQQALAKG